MKKAVLLLIVGMVLTCYSGISLVSVYGADATIHYDGGTKEFAYSNLDSGDLFDDFKDLIPGDTRTQRIYISAHNINTDTNIYLKLNKADNKELLEHINIYCYVNGVLVEEDDDVILINHFNDDDGIELKIVVEVPIEVGNEIAGASYSLLWTFVAEEDEQWVAETPDTGANNAGSTTVSNAISWLVLAMGIGVAIYGAWRIIRFRRHMR